MYVLCGYFFSLSWVCICMFLYLNHPAQFKTYGRYQLIDCKLKATVTSEKVVLHQGKLCTIDCSSPVFDPHGVHSSFQIVNSHLLFHHCSAGSSLLLMCSENVIWGHDERARAWNNKMRYFGNCWFETKRMPINFPLMRTSKKYSISEIPWALFSTPDSTHVDTVMDAWFQLSRYFLCFGRVVP